MGYAPTVDRCGEGAVRFRASMVGKLSGPVSMAGNRKTKMKNAIQNPI